jgi:hypothetical protein
MKKINKPRKIKNAKLPKRKSKKIVYHKGSSYMKQIMLQPDSPLNTNEYLIDNNSSSFCNDDEDCCDIKTSSIIKFNNDINSELNIREENQNELTNDETINFNEDLTQKGGKEKI